MSCRLASAGIGCDWLPVRLPKLAIFDLFMTLNREPVRVSRGIERMRLPGLWPHVAARRLRLALVALDIETLAAHGHDQSLVGERGQGPLGCAV